MNRNLIAFGLAAISVAGVVRADILAPGTYHLHNHPDGTERPPLYGLRLDELYNVTPGHDIWTFDFDHEGSDMRMTIGFADGVRFAHIFGVTYGGLDVGASYHPDHQGLYEVDFTYQDVTVRDEPGAANDNDDFAVVTPNYSNYGTIKPYVDGEVEVEGDDEIGLWDYAGDFGFTFRLGNEDDDLGHRGFDGISGWGWLNYQAGSPHIASSDWLFTVGNPVPAPGAIGLGVVGLALVRGLRRRMSR